MRTITTYLVSIILVFSIAISNAQDSTPENDNAEKIEILKELKNKIKIEEREFLKEEVDFPDMPPEVRSWKQHSKIKV